MKKSMLITLALLVFAMGTSYAATTIIVTNNSGTTTTYTDLPTALAAMAAGNSMNITDFDGPLLMGTNGVALPKTFPSWCTVSGPAGRPATIVVPTGNGGNNSFGTADHIHLNNLILDGQTPLGGESGGGATKTCACIVGTVGAVSTFNNVTFKGCWWNTLNANDSSGNGTTMVQDDGCTFTNCLFIASGTCLGIDDSWATTFPTVNHLSLDHCTLVGLNGAEPINFSSACDGTVISKHLRLTNSIVSGRGGAVGIVFSGTSPNAASDVDENHNVYDCFWNQIYSQGGGYQGAPAGAGDIVFDFRKMAGGTQATTPPAVEFFDKYPTNTSGGGITDASIVNFKLTQWAASNICYGAGSDGKNIGFDDAVTMPVELSTFSVE